MPRFSVLSLLAGIARMTGHLLAYWKLLLIAVFFVSPVGPHLRWEYTYRDAYGHRSYVSCTYLGSSGFITPGYLDDCPVIAWLDARGFAP